jgi:hypothetical protein
MRATADELTFLSTKYNAAHMPTFAKREDLLIFCTPAFKAAVDVEALAAAFNLDQALMHGRIIAIPESQFGIDGAQAIMTTRDFFVMADQHFETTSAWNPVSLQNNYFLHHWQVISASRFVPAILFTTKAGDEILSISTPVTSVSNVSAFDRDGDEVTEVVRGEIYSLDADVTTSPADGVNDGVRWTVTGAASSRTYVTQKGVLHVGGDETAATLTVRATSTWLDPENVMRDGETATLALTVTGVSYPEWPDTSGPVTGITVAGAAVEPAFSATTYTYTVDVEGGTATVDDVVVTGPQAGDVDITVNNDGDVITVEVAGAPGDPVYTVNVVDPTP